MKTFKQVGEIFSSFIPVSALKQEKAGAMSRPRLFTKEKIFWAFLGQVFDSNGGCKEVVRKLQGYAVVGGLQLPSSSTSSYCVARQKLEEATLFEIFQHITQWSKNAAPTSNMLNGRRVVVDGTGVSMPDTAENQARWPQLSSQKTGCGFPSGRICALFSWIREGCSVTPWVIRKIMNYRYSMKIGQPSDKEIFS
ncbi:MAG: hypothetical protein V2I36_07685 [Desulfopila sp.]|nr:hypothetical protein [Desulfopila sp.]